MYTSFQVFKRDFLNLLKNPMWFWYNTLFPFVLVAILGFLFSGNYGGNVTSYDYYGITMMIMSVLNTALTASNSFMEERIKLSNLRIIFSPVKRVTIYLSKILATFCYSIICYSIAMLGLGLIFGVNFGGANVVYVLLLFFVTVFFSSALGVLFCCIFKSENTANQILSTLISVFAILGGVFFQIDGLGGVITKISYFSPVRWLLDSVFKIIYDNNLTTFLPIFLIMVGLSAICLIGCRAFFRTEDYV